MEGQVSVVIPADPAVYMKVQRPYEPVRLSLQEDLYSYRLMLMVEEGDLMVRSLATRRRARFLK